MVECAQVNDPKERHNRSISALIGLPDGAPSMAEQSSVRAELSIDGRGLNKREGVCTSEQSSVIRKNQQ